MGVYGTSVILCLQSFMNGRISHLKINTAENSFSTTAVKVDLVCTALQLCKRGSLRRVY